MAPLPALSKTYATRRNTPYPAEATASDIQRSAIWLLKESLINGVVTGTLSGTRHANSIWTVYYSCDGTTAGTAGDAVDRWPDYTKVVQNINTVAHSWIVLYNATSSLWLCIDANHASTNLRLSWSRVAHTGGTTTSGPTNTESWQSGLASADTVSSNVAFIADNTVASTHYAHFTTSDDGQFFFLLSRSGLGFFSTFSTIIKSVNNHVSDTRNYFAIHQATSGGRGSGVNTITGSPSYCTSRAPNNTGIVTTGGLTNGAFGGAAWAGLNGVDDLSGNYPGFPLFVSSIAPQVAFRGQIPDLYLCGTAPVGASIPSAGAQERTVVGDLFVPFVGGAPIT